MKKLLQLLLLCLTPNLFYANEAIVIVVQAPLLREPKMDSSVLQFKRNAEHVYVPSRISHLNPLPEFIETFDKAGNVAYIPSKYIKIITNDDSEDLTSISFEGSDPTDYRLAEPIPNSYPFSNFSYLKASFSFSLGNNLKDPYTFNHPISNQDYSRETGGRFVFTKKIESDKYDRFYYGLILNISSVTNNLEINNGQELAAENRSTLKLGPILVYDSYKNENFRLSLGTGFTYNYHRSLVKIAYKPFLDQEIIEQESRFFDGFSISPFLTAFAQAENVIPNVDLIIGTDIFLYFQRTLKAHGSVNYPDFWVTNDMTENTKPQANMFLGVQVKY